MDVFAFREELITEYERFSRSFTKIRAEDISEVVDSAYASGHFWPAPLIQLNPNFEPGGFIDDLVGIGLLDEECSRIFRLKHQENPSGEPLRLHRHQTDAIEIASRGKSYVLTTGTGSGKSLGYFIPIVNDVLRRKRTGNAGKGITAIVVYPMNALCNSQLEELQKYLRLGYGEGNEPVTFARYTGQESTEERDQIAKNPPDILLTNYVMLELIMTRFLSREALNNARFGAPNRRFTGLPTAPAPFQRPKTARNAGFRPPFAVRGRTNPTSSGHRIPAGDQQIGETQQQRDPLRILRQSPVAHFRMGFGILGHPLGDSGTPIGQHHIVNPVRLEGRLKKFRAVS